MEENNDINVKDPFPLSNVTMPLVRLMVDVKMSWAERELIAMAINESIIQWHCLMAEHNRRNQPSIATKVPETIG